MHLELKKEVGAGEIARIPTIIELDVSNEKVYLRRERHLIYGLGSILETILTNFRNIIGGYPKPGEWPKKIEIEIFGGENKMRFFSCHFSENNETLSLKVNFEFLREAESELFFILYHELTHPLLPEKKIGEDSMARIHTFQLVDIAVRKELIRQGFHQYMPEKIFNHFRLQLAGEIYNILMHEMMTQISLISIGDPSIVQVLDSEIKVLKELAPSYAKEFREKMGIIELLRFFGSHFNRYTYFYALKKSLPVIEYILRSESKGKAAEEAKKRMRKFYPKLLNLKKTYERNFNEIFGKYPEDVRVAKNRIEKLLEMYSYDTVFDNERMAKFGTEMAKIFCDIGKKHCKLHTGWGRKAKFAIPIHLTENTVQTALGKLTVTMEKLRNVLQEEIKQRIVLTEGEMSIINEKSHTFEDSDIYEISHRARSPGITKELLELFINCKMYMPKEKTWYDHEEKDAKLPFPRNFRKTIHHLSVFGNKTMGRQKILRKKIGAPREQKIFALINEIHEITGGLEEGYLDWEIEQAMKKAP